MKSLQQINTRAKNIESEIISKLIALPKSISEVASIVQPEDFYIYQKEFITILNSQKNDKNLSVEFSKINSSIDHFMNPDVFRKVETVCKELKEVSNARKIYGIYQRAIESIPEENVEKFVSDIQREVINSVSSESVSKSDINSIINEFHEKQEIYQDKKKNGFKLIGLSTGYSKLDTIIDGLRPAHLWVIGGYTNMGKTTASLNIVAEMIRQGKKVIFYSLEMSSVDVLTRLLGIMSKSNGIDIVKGNTTDYESSLSLIIESNFTIHTGKNELSEIIYSMYEENTKDDPALFVVDFIQLLTVKGSKSEYEATTTSALELQQIAKRLQVPIIVLSQITNESAKKDNDVVMGFKGSGAIAAAADFAIEITLSDSKAKMNLEENSPLDMKWVVKKNRHGRCGYIDMQFIRHTGEFLQGTTLDSKF